MFGTPPRDFRPSWSLLQADQIPQKTWEIWGWNISFHSTPFSASGDRRTDGKEAHDKIAFRPFCCFVNFVWLCLRFSPHVIIAPPFIHISFSICLSSSWGLPPPLTHIFCRDGRFWDPERFPALPGVFGPGFCLRKMGLGGQPAVSKFGQGGPRKPACRGTPPPPPWPFGIDAGGKNCGPKQNILGTDRRPKEKKLGSFIRVDC